MMIACMIDLWQLRSTRTTSPCRAEDPGSVGFRFADRSGVLHQRAELGDRYGQVAAQRVLAEELMKGGSDRGFQERGAAAVTGRVPGVTGFVREPDERFEERRQQRFQVLATCFLDPARNERGRVLELPDVPIDPPEHVDRDLLDRGAISEQEDRQRWPRVSQRVDQGLGSGRTQHRGARVLKPTVERVVGVPIDHESAERRCTGDDLLSVIEVCGRDHVGAVST
jgi:hypothetical protein